MHTSDDPWYCSEQCSQEEMDHIRRYSITATWYGLMDQCHRDAIREADGLAMMALWRINMRYWRGNHYKYMIIAHRLLTGTFSYIYFTLNYSFHYTQSWLYR